MRDGAEKEPAGSASLAGRLEGREEALDGALADQGHRAVAVEVLAMVVLESHDQRHAHHRASRDVRRLEREAVPVLDLAPRLGQAVHRHREVLPVEPLGYLRVAEEHQAEQRKYPFQGRGAVSYTHLTLPTIYSV